MSNTIGLEIARNQDASPWRSMLVTDAETLDIDWSSLQIPPVQKQQRYCRIAVRWQTVSVNELDIRLLPQTTLNEAVPREALVPDPWLSTLIFRRMLEGIPSVEKLLARVQDWGLTFWIIVNNSTEDIRYQIYDKEWELMQRFPGLGVTFDLIDREDRPLEQLVPLQDIDSQFTFREVVHAI